MIQIKTHDPNYFFLKIDNDLLSDYNEGFSLGDIFKVKGCSILTAADELLINTKLDRLKSNIKTHLESENSPFKGVKLNQKEKDSDGIYKILPYRIFDNRHYYDSKMTEARCQNLTKHESIKGNYSLGFTASIRDNNKFQNIIVTKNTPDVNFFTGKGQCHSAPLYIYNEQNKGQI